MLCLPAEKKRLFPFALWLAVRRSSFSLCFDCGRERALSLVALARLPSLIQCDEGALPVNCDEGSIAFYSVKSTPVGNGFTV